MSLNDQPNPGAGGDTLFIVLAKCIMQVMCAYMGQLILLTMIINIINMKRKYLFPVPAEIIIHSCPECTYTTDRSYSLKLHMYTHSDEKNIHCPHPGCDYRTNNPVYMKTHSVNHLGILPFSCDVADCNFTCTLKKILDQHHKCMHGDTKEFQCCHPGCTFRSNLKGNLTQHMATHSTEPSFVCGIGECDFSTTSLRYLKRHQVGHTGRELKFPCTHDSCGYKSAYKTHLETHMRMHNNERNYICDFPMCDLSFISSSQLARHKKTHSPDAQKYHKKQEKRVTKMLTLWDYQYDPEVTINASRNNCLTDTNRHYSRLDYHIINITSCIVLLEVDEDSHYWYTLSCELGRMADIRASLLKAGITKPIYWIRYNPNGKYNVDFEEVKISREKRELALKAKLEELCSPDFVPENEVSIHYMYYDLMSEEMGPEIMYDEAFPEVMREVVSWK